MKQTKKDALQKCDGVVKGEQCRRRGQGWHDAHNAEYRSPHYLATCAEFAACSTGRTFSVTWACRSQYRDVQECMKQYTSEEAMAEKRREFLKEKRLAAAESTQ